MKQLKKIDDGNWILEKDNLEFKISKFSDPQGKYNLFSATIHDNYIDKHIMNITGFFSLESIGDYCKAFADGYDYGYINYSKENSTKEKK
jgi:hypothetical protein